MKRATVLALLVAGVSGLRAQSDPDGYQRFVERSEQVCLKQLAQEQKR